MNIVNLSLELIGSLGLLLYGMKLMSDGIQKSAGDSLHRILNYMTGNRFLAALTGLGITAIIQSSGATTVMTVSFVNAGMLTLKQAIGVIFGANIGTTVTAWIVSLFGFNFKLSAIAVPLFGFGFFLTFIKKLKKEGLGEAIMGFALLFMGLELLAKAMPNLTPEQIYYLNYFSDKGVLGLFVGVAIGMVFTMLIHSSSASTAIILTMSYNGMLSWEFAASMVLGGNIGSTFDAVLAAIGTKLNARRAAAVHVLFNCIGTIIAMIFFKPFLRFVDFLIPGDVTPQTITNHLAMLHTVFNASCTLLFLPFVNQLARFVEFIIKPSANEPPSTYVLNVQEVSFKDNAESHIFMAEREILDLSTIIQKMFISLLELLKNPSTENLEETMEFMSQSEDYVDQMQEELTRYLVKVSRLPLSEKSQNNVRQMIQIVDDLESITDDIFSASLLLDRSARKKIKYEANEMERLEPYLEVVDNFIKFVHTHLNKPLSKSELQTAHAMEDQIDLFRKQLKKLARKRLEEGADVKAELSYIDLVRSIEKMGDHAFSISEALAATR